MAFALLASRSLDFTNFPKCVCSMVRQVLGDHAYFSGHSHTFVFQQHGLDSPLAWLWKSADSLLRSVTERLHFVTQHDIIHQQDWSHLHDFMQLLHLRLVEGDGISGSVQHAQCPTLTPSFVVCAIFTHMMLQSSDGIALQLMARQCFAHKLLRSKTTCFRDFPNASFVTRPLSIGATSKFMSNVDVRYSKLDLLLVLILDIGDLCLALTLSQPFCPCSIAVMKQCGERSF